MLRATSIALLVFRVTAFTQVVLGLLFWSGRALTLVNVHMLVGTVFVITLWVLAGLAARVRVSLPLVLGAVAWGFVVPAFGMLHPRILPGPGHWIIRVLHLLVGIAAMAIGDNLGKSIRRRRMAPDAAGVRTAA